MVAATIRFQITALTCAMVLVLPPEVGIRTAVAAAAVAQTGAAPEPAQQPGPPQICFRTRPAVLVNLDGDPIWSPIQGSDLEFAVNTNWDLFETPSKTLYLRNNDTWLTASDLKGPWSPAGKLPPSFAKLPADDNWKDVKAHNPGRPPTAGAVPMVYVSTSPAEMLLLQGAPVYQPVPGYTNVQLPNPPHTRIESWALGVGR